MIIDPHTHLGDYISATRPFPATADNLLKAIDATGIGIEKVITMPMGMEWDYSRLNTMVAKAVEKYPDRIIGFTRINPYMKGAVEELKRCKKLGITGLKLHPMYSVFRPNDPKLVFPLVEKAHELGMPVMFHTGLSIYATPAYVIDVAYQFPDVTFIMAHCGYDEYFAESITSYALKLKNLIWDLTGIWDMNKLMTAVEVLDPSRIIGGSDWPYYSILMSMKTRWDELKISESARKAILGDNIVRILGI